MVDMFMFQLISTIGPVIVYVSFGGVYIDAVERAQRRTIPT